jgi:RHS repeat-associated protein
MRREAMIVKTALAISVGIALAILVSGGLGVLAQSSEQEMEAAFNVPFCPLDTANPIDGIIDGDWEHGVQSDVQIGDFPAVLRARHNGTNLFLAIELFDSEAILPPDDLTFCVVFDNGDGHLFGKGDDCIEVHIADQLEIDGDHYGIGCGGFESDDQQDVTGYGTWSMGDVGATFTIEISRPIDSGDESDIALRPCTETLFAITFCCSNSEESDICVEQSFEWYIHPKPNPIIPAPVPRPSTLGGLPSSNQPIEKSSCDVCKENTIDSSVFDQTGESIFLHNGELYLQQTDLVTSGPGLSWSLTRTYRSESLDDGPQGYGWQLNYSQRLAEANASNIDQVQALFDNAKVGDVVRIGGGGRVDLFSLDAGTYVTPGGLSSDIAAVGEGGFVERDRNGGTTAYHAPNSMGMSLMSEMSDRNGNTMRFEHNILGQLVGVLDTLGRRIVYSYDTAGRLVEVRDFADRAIVYRYDEQGNLVAVTSPTVTGTPTGNDFPNGTTAHYTYSSGFEEEWLNHNLLTITAPNEVASGGLPYVQFEYDEGADSLHTDRVLRQTLGGTNASGVPAGGTIIYDYKTFLEVLVGPGLSLAERLELLMVGYAERMRVLRDGPPTPEGIKPAVFQTTITDRNGNITEYRFDAHGHATRLREFTNRDVRDWEPDFYETQFEYDDHGNLTRGIRPGGSVIEYVYGDGRCGSCGGDELLSTTILPDARGGDQTSISTSRTTEPIYHQLSTATDPLGHTTTYTYDYQEGTDYAGLASKVGKTESEVHDLLALAGIAMGLGDVNGDGRTDQTSGSLIRIDYPTVSLLPDSNMAAIEGHPSQEIVETYAYNDRGQMVREVDPEGNVTLYEYYADNAPLGAGQLKQVIRDAESEAGRNSGTDPEPTRIRSLYEYDVVSNITRTTDGRGVATDYVVNELDQVVQIVRAAAHGIFEPDPTEPLELHDFKYLERIFYDANGSVVRRQVEVRGNTSNVGADNLGTGTSFVDFTYAYDILDNLIETTEEVDDDLDLVTRYRYDANGNQVLTILPAGNATSPVYDERGLLYQATRGALSPPVTALLAGSDPTDYDVRGGIPSTITYHYDEDGNLIEIVDAADTDGSEDNNSDRGGLGDRTRYIYDGFGRRTSLVDSVGNQTVWQYDAVSYVVRELRFGPDGGSSPTSDGPDTLLFPVSSNEMIVAANLVNDNLLEATEYVYDEVGRLSQTDRVLFMATSNYARIPDLADGATDIGKGDLTPNDDQDISGIHGVWIHGRVSSRTEYDRDSRVVFRVEDDEDTYLTYCDGVGRVIQTLDPEGNSVEMAYDDNGNVIEIRETDVSQVPGVAYEVFLTTDYYDSLGRVRRTVDNLGGTFRYRYDSRGNLVVVSDAQGPLHGDVIQRRAFSAGTLTVNEINDPGNATLYTYDGLGHMLSEDIVLTADGQGTRAIGVTREGIRMQPQGQRLIPDDLAPDQNQGGSDGLITIRYVYDANSLLASLTDDNGNRTRYSYDNLNRQLTETKGDCTSPRLADRCDPPTTVRFEYDPDGNAARMIDASGTIIDCEFDGVNRLEGCDIMRAPGVVGTTATCYEYDGLHRMIRATDNNEPGDPSDDSTVIYTYDSQSRVAEERQQIGEGDPKIVSSTWRAENLRIELEYPNERVVESTYDRLDRLDSIGDEGASSRIADYDHIGYRVLVRAYPQNGTRMTYLDDTGTRVVGYDGLRRPIQLQHLRDDGSRIVGFEHTYDRLHNRLSEEKLHDSVNDEAYRYDSAYRLIDFDRPNARAIDPLHSDWTLDGVGNWSSVVTTEHGAPVTESREHSSFNGLIQRENETPIDLEYDDNGNLIADGTFSFQWDYRNRLRSVSHADIGIPLVATYSYDALGRRVRKSVVDGLGITDFYYDGWQVIEERDVSDLLLRHYVYGVYIDEPLVLDRNQDADVSAIDPRDQRLFYHQNALYSVFALTSEEGKIVEGYQYDAYGRQTVFQPGGDGAVDIPTALPVLGGATAVGNPYMFVGRRADGETGLLYYRNRYYSAALGRFVSRDSSRYETGPNLYEYVESNPSNWLDPDGNVTRDKSRINCLGYATGEGDYIAPDPKAKESLQSVLQNLGWKCKKGTKSKDCECKCREKMLMVYIYRYSDNKRNGKVQDPWTDPWIRAKGKNDYHAIKCDTELEDKLGTYKCTTWSYVPAAMAKHMVQEKHQGRWRVKYTTVYVPRFDPITKQVVLILETGIEHSIDWWKNRIGTKKDADAYWTGQQVPVKVPGHAYCCCKPAKFN